MRTLKPRDDGIPVRTHDAQNGRRSTSEQPNEPPPETEAAKAGSTSQTFGNLPVENDAEALWTLPTGLAPEARRTTAARSNPEA